MHRWTAISTLESALRWALFLVAAGLALPAFAAGAVAGGYEDARREMLEAVRLLVGETRAETGRAELAPEVMRALAEVPRHEFVPPERREQAYRNRPLPIGYGQTISQPYIVALMTDMLGAGVGSRVLEVGTGSAYQAAVLAELGAHVYSVEIIAPLAAAAQRRLERLGFRNVDVKLGDGYYGWSEHAPFDAIIVTAAIDHVPPPLVRQLTSGGRMVIPVGPRFGIQRLLLVEKGEDEGEVFARSVLPVRFVPLTGEH